MDNIFQKIPFLRIIVAFAIGIVIAKYFNCNHLISLVAAVATVFVLGLVNRKYSYKNEPLFGIFIALLFVLLGNSVYTWHNKQPHFFEKGVAIATLLETSQEKQNSFKSFIQIEAFRNNDSLTQTNENVLVYFEKTEEAKNLSPGMQILIAVPPIEIKNFGTPYGFDYKSYLKNQGIYRQLYLDKESWRVTDKKSKSIRIYAESFREKLLTIYRIQNLGEKETEILSALTLGYKRDLDPETKRIFSAAGAMHILAVSGLHVGIIFMVITFIFGFLRKQKTGKYIFVITAILLLWAYAFVTGLSPSVLRASTMFTIVIIGTNINRMASIYNSLAASALFLLLFNPNHLFEVGFQLSYSAVFGIVFLQPKLIKIVHVQNKIAVFFWNLITVSVAAQIATFPLAVYYFNQFPVFFWLSNIVVIPAVIVLIPLGLGLLLFAQIPILALILSTLCKWLLQIVFFILQWIESLPYSVLNLTLQPIELFFLTGFLFFTFIFINKHLANHLIVALVSMLLLFVSVFVSNIYQSRECEMIVYNNNTNRSIQFIKGKKTYVVSDQAIQNGDFLYKQILEVKHKKRLSTPIYLNVESTFEDDVLFLKNGILSFNGRIIMLETENNKLPNYFTPNYLITNENYRYKNPPHITSKIITTNYLSSAYHNLQMHSLKSAGTLIEKW